MDARSVSPVSSVSLDVRTNSALKIPSKATAIRINHKAFPAVEGVLRVGCRFMRVSILSCLQKEDYIAPVLRIGRVADAKKCF